MAKTSQGNWDLDQQQSWYVPLVALRGCKQISSPLLPPQLCPKQLHHFDKRKIVSLAAGDEFSLALDDTGTPWVWGKAEHGQVSRWDVMSWGMVT